MMTIIDKERYRRYKSARVGTDGHLLYELWLPFLLFGSMGAITWAIRGTGGWGGIDGTIVPGLTWGLLWYYICHRRGIDARGIVLWLGLGLALGGELGYGQYVSWIQGRFHAGDEVLYIEPWKGYAWFVICGIGWAAPGGIILGWAVNSTVSVRVWFVRIILIILFLSIILNLPLFGTGIINRLGTFFIKSSPGLLFPNASMNLYQGELDSHLLRTVYTNTQNFAALVWWLIALCISACQRDRATLMSGAVIGGGFGIGFALSAVWCLGYSFAPAYTDWWKIWELQSGFSLGILYVIVLYLFTGRLEESNGHGEKLKPVNSYQFRSFSVSQTVTTIFLAIGGFALIFVAGYEYFFWTGLLLALFYMVSLSAVSFFGTSDVTELRKRVSILYSVFLLIFILLHGATSRAGVLLELYDGEEVNQYAWPLERIMLFLPVALLLIFFTLKHLFRIYRSPSYSTIETRSLEVYMTDLFTFISFTGAISISGYSPWPSKIVVLYALLLFVALFAFTRINRHLTDIGI